MTATLVFVPLILAFACLALREARVSLDTIFSKLLRAYPPRD